MPNYKPYLYLGMGIIIAIMTFGCTPSDRVTIKKGNTEISIPREDYEKAEALHKNLLRGYDRTPKEHPVSLPK